MCPVYLMIKKNNLITFTDCTKNLGAYTIQLNAVLNESGNTNFAGKELPSHKIKFTVNGK